MAISKKIINLNNNPTTLPNIPETNPEHQSAPEGFHHKDPGIKCKLYTSFTEAKNACELVYLKPGEAHTEFYRKDNVYHCVVAIGNIYHDTEHLYLTDSGNEYSIDDRLSQMHAEVVLLSKLFTVLSKDVSTLNLNIIEFETNVNNSLEEIRHDIENFEHQISSQVNAIDTKVDNFINEATQEIEDISIYVSNFGERIDTLEEGINDLSTNINNKLEDLNSKIQIESEINQIQNVSINTLEQKSEELSLQITDLSTKVDQEVENINEHIDASIHELEDLINEFQPITDSSIESLFHDDIYTINLCCYTIGGHIEIHDNIAGTDMGGDSSRVAPCTPFNEYKTYVNGDDITLVAVANEADGYKFVKWLIDGEEEYLDASLPLTFEDEDINCIGYTEYAREGHDPLRHGYTAVFKRLHKLTLSFDVNVEGEYEGDAPTREIDKIEITVKHDGKIIDYRIIEDNGEDQYMYIGEDESLDIRILSDESHTFNKFLVNGVHEVTETEIHYDAIGADINVEAFLTEIWIKVGADAVPADAGIIYGNMKSYKVGSEVPLRAELVDEEYSFNHWEDSDPNVDLSEYIISGDINNPRITIKVSAEVNKYNIKAIFAKNEITATFVDWDGAVLEGLILVPGETPEYSGETPIRDDEYDPEGNPDYPYIEYTFIGWEPELKPVFADTTYTAVYSSRRYRKVKQTTYIREDDIENISSDKEYVLVAAVNNTDNVIYVNSYYNTTNSTYNCVSTLLDLEFLNITEFEFIDETELNDFIGIEFIEQDNDINYYIIKDLSDTSENCYLTSISSNKFGQKTDRDSAIVNAKWFINNEFNLVSNNTGRIIQYNASSPRFAPYTSSQKLAYLFYKHVEEKKEYIGFLMGTMIILNNIAHASNTTFILSIGDDLEN